MQRLWRDMSTFRVHLAQTMREANEREAGAAHFVKVEHGLQSGEQSFRG